MSEKTNLIKHVWFDVNGTLCLYTPAYNEAHDRLRYETYAEATGHEVNDELKAEYERLYHEYSSNSMVFRSLGLPTDFWMQRFNKLEEGFAYSPVPEIYETLKKLKDILPISIFTNNSKVGTSKILQEINVKEEWFTHIITGDEVHERKPDLHGYTLAVERSGIPAEQNLYVGDREGADIKPAKAVGMQACLVYSHSDEADYSFDKFEQVLTLFPNK